MEERGRLLYEEEIKERRAQAELSTNHMGIFGGLLVLILTWTVYGVEAWRGLEVHWLVFGLVVALLLTVISLFVIDTLLRFELTQFLPVKVYEKGVLMPTTPLDRIIWRKEPFIHYSNLSDMKFMRTHKPDQKDMLTAITRQRKNYPKQYDPTSEEPKNILKAVKKAFPQVKVAIDE